MPIYEFQCLECEHEFEELVLRRDEAVACPDCGADDVKRLLSGFAVTGDARTAGDSCGSCKPSTGKCKGCSCH